MADGFSKQVPRRRTFQRPKRHFVITSADEAHHELHLLARAAIPTTARRVAQMAAAYSLGVRVGRLARRDHPLPRQGNTHSDRCEAAATIASARSRAVMATGPRLGGAPIMPFIIIFNPLCCNSISRQRAWASLHPGTESYSLSARAPTPPPDAHAPSLPGSHTHEHSTPGIPHTVHQQPLLTPHTVPSTELRPQKRHRNTPETLTAPSCHVRVLSTVRSSLPAARGGGRWRIRPFWFVSQVFRLLALF